MFHHDGINLGMLEHTWELCSAERLTRLRWSMGGLSESAHQLICASEIHHSTGDDYTWRDADAIGTHLVDSIAIAVQRCTGMALRVSLNRERRLAMGASAT